MPDQTIQIEHMRNDINQITNLVRNNLCRLDRRYDAFQDLVNAVEDLNLKSQQFHRLSRDNKQKSYVRNLSRLIPVVICLLTLLISFIGILFIFSKN
mgnify:CR=1 FL=1